MSSIYERIVKKEKEYDDTYRYLDRYKGKVWSEKAGVSNSEVSINKTIWILWLQGIEKAPRLVKRCVESVKKNMPEDYDLVIIDESNIKDYIKLPDFIYEKFIQGKISRTHFSDILRIELLYIYGGCWIDATVFCSDKIPKYMVSGSLFLFKGSMISESIIKNSSWWMMASKGSRIISQTRDYLYHYWQKEELLKNYYLLHIVISKVIEEDSCCRAEYNSIPYICNTNPHVLYSQMEFAYEANKWDIIKENSKIHKLSYKKRFLQGDIYNFYSAFMDGVLEGREIKGI